ncbi:phage tail spike protein [Joostella sp.]|uniref:phage tail spike protein n=1 Tax=Joostella sp. TaxID=2231138 RepID=UPI003A93B7B0
MKIYRNEVEIHDIEIDANTELKQSISGEDLISSRFTLPEKIDLQIGDYVTWNGLDYTILDEPQVKKSQGYFTYNLQFKSSLYLLKNVLVLLDDSSEFYLFGNAQTLVSQIISNLNRVYGGYYADFVEDTEEINFYFNNYNCLSAIQNIASQLSCEFRIEGKKITFKKKIGQETGLVFEYRKELREIERQSVQNSELVTVLYPFGSTRNITTDYGSKRLRVSPISNNTSIFGTIERTHIFEDVYPRFKGSVSATPTLTTFKDTGIDFDINNQLAPGMTAKVTFNTGDLAGREFEISAYQNSSKTVEIIAYSDDTGLTLPNETLKPRIGDKYVFWDIKMPQSYIDNAEIELQEKAVEYLETYSQPNVVYKITPNYPKLRMDNTKLNLGDIITIQDDDFGISFEVRILSLTQKLVNEFEYSLTIGNQITLNYLTQVINDTKNIRNEIYLNEIKQNELYNRLYYNLKNVKTAVYVNRNEFDADTYYYNNQNRRDYVFRYDSEGVKYWYYFVGEDHTKAEWIQSNWQLIGDSFEIIATDTLLAEQANIGNWHIVNENIVSQSNYTNPNNSNEQIPFAILNGNPGELRFSGLIDNYTEFGNRTYEQKIVINNESITATRSGDSQQLAATSYLNSKGVFANSAGTDALPASTGIEAKGALVGLGYGKMNKGYGGEFIAGVIGRAKNYASNPAPSYGGAFWELLVNGLNFAVKIAKSNYLCSINDTYIGCYNYNSNIQITLPINPTVGKIYFIKRMSAGVNVVGNGYNFWFDENQGNDVWLSNTGEANLLIFDGNYWTRLVLK